MVNSYKRNNGIDILRIISMIMICFLHVLLKGGVLETISSTVQHSVYWLIEIMCLCSVNCFALISGYVSSCDKFKIKRILTFWAQIIFYSFFISCVVFALGYSPDPSFYILISNLFPIICRKFWYATDYMIVMITMPLVVKCISRFNILRKKSTMLLIIAYFALVTVFSGITNNGNSTIWLSFLYLVGKKIKSSEHILKTNRPLCYFLLVLSLFVGYIGKVSFGNDYFIGYTSLNIFLLSIALLLIFAKIKTEAKINRISKYVFGVYLFQCNEMLRAIISHSFVFINNYNIIVGTLMLAVSALLLFCLGVIVEISRVKLYEILNVDVLIDILSNKFDGILLMIGKN